MNKIQQADSQLRDKYKATFSQPDDVEVLHDIMRRGYFFNSEIYSDTPEAIGKRNLVIEILMMLGSMNSYKTTQAITRAITALPAYEGGTNKEEEEEEEVL